MAYSELTDIQYQLSEDELIQLTDDSEAGVVDADVITRAIADADEEIDGYIGTRLTVPLTTVPGIIRKVSVDIAIYNLYSRRHDSIPEIRKERYEIARKFLQLVAEGKISMGQDDPSGNPPESAGIDYDGEDQVFTPTVLDRF